MEHLGKSKRVQKGLEEFRKVEEGFGGSGMVLDVLVFPWRVWEGPGGFRRVWRSGRVWEDPRKGLEGSGRVWEGMGGSGRVQKGLEGS